MAIEESIPDVFAGADIFITGGSGFMGKVLIEKLLRSCPDVGKLFVLLRPRRGKPASERIADLVQIPLFDKLRETFPENLDKIVPINGDCSELGLGMDQKSLESIGNVQFVFHTAASVRFDDPIVSAIKLNTRGTREVLELCKTLKHLKAIVHVSTTYSNPEVMDVEERIYPPKMDWRKAIEVAENIDEQILESLALKMSSFSPNTYTFTKGLAEQICLEYGQQLPLVIFRPSVVTNSESEPIPGWIDNFNGPVSMLVGSGMGVVRAGFITPENRLNCIPVDVCIKAILVAAWKRSREPFDGGHVPIYNCAAERYKTVPYKYIVTDGKNLYEKNPLVRTVWYPGGVAFSNIYVFHFFFMILQLFPAVLVDIVLKISGKTMLATRLSRKMFYTQIALEYFIKNDWTFKTKNFRNLYHDLLECDRESFSTKYLNIPLSEYYIRCILGGRRYLFKETDDSLPKARRKIKRLKFIDLAAKWITLGSLLMVLYSRYC
ncbi:putative fatty acyl-CoA reductase CG5065 [Uranotaenia lowii]|uniref:putative fatty acyl-CoA reductase CG5065 n=1 Tax=Uranotaenia lowii TaxID=190385 RepID=UPI002478DCD3|nr:putative fatty acyl-CoA reductase CG5065 [Uranotaenia lowii]